MKLFFYIEYYTKFGEKLILEIQERDFIVKTHVMSWAKNAVWKCEFNHDSYSIIYKYKVINDEGKILREELVNHKLCFLKEKEEFLIYDFWNQRNFPENYLNNKILKNKLASFYPEKLIVLRNHSHLFRIEAPIYNANWKLVVLGNTPSLGEWDDEKAIHMLQTEMGVWETLVTIPEDQILEYKYAILDITKDKVIDFENRTNRLAFPNMKESSLSIISDHNFGFKSYQMYHDAGVAIPVFSLRSDDGFGVGEFNDLKKLGDWAKETSLGIVQILPINDTTANYSWTDSYPYSAVSIYALHPQYISIEKLDFLLPKNIVYEFENKKEYLNNLELIDYEKVMFFKWKYLKIIFNAEKKNILENKFFQKFIKDNEAWLLPYCAFCVLRDQYKTPNFNSWKTHQKYDEELIKLFFYPENENYESSILHAWVQFQLHKQLTSAVEYIHNLGISLKGDLPIGIYRYSVEAWKEPHLFDMDFQAGAPPDQFANIGQNWEFPTYNWEEMKRDNYQWWKNRFKALEKYFDAMRIDHILGFFRIWRIPISATQGILGYFYPAIAIRIEEFYARNIPFSFKRYCTPFINDSILHDCFGVEADKVYFFIIKNLDETYSFKKEFNSQRKIKDYFIHKNQNEFCEKLLNLSANVLFLVEEKEHETVFHPRFNLFKTDSYRYLSEWERFTIDKLYEDYFYKRQNVFWKESAMEKLPIILNSTEMLICGEDLGMVPDCVPEVMDELGIVALKVQRMPPNNLLFFDPKKAGYMNVVTASSHDSSTLRQWWKEDKNLTQKFYNLQLNLLGIPPEDMNASIAKIIMEQHLSSNAMLAIFPIQEFFATDDNFVNPKLDHERINDPSVFPHYWRYRMHLSVEYLLNISNFNLNISKCIIDNFRN